MRTVSLIAGLGLLLTAGVVHGLWTDRWQRSTHLADAAARLDSLPTEIAGWTSVPYEQEAEALALTGAVGHFSRTFTDPHTGEKVLVMLLCGKPSQMVVHRPEDCYQAAGWMLSGAANRFTVRPPEEPPGEFFTGRFTRDEATGPSQMRIFWSWLTPAGWTAPANPRWSLSREKVLFKLYVLRNMTGSSVQAADDPCARLIGLLMPVMRRTLIES